METDIISLIVAVTALIITAIAVYFNGLEVRTVAENTLA